MTTLSLIQTLQQRYGDDFSGICLQDKLLLTGVLFVALHGMQRCDLQSIHSGLTFWGDDFASPGLETTLELFEGESVFTWFQVVESLLPKMKADFQQLGTHMQRLQQSGLDADSAEAVGLLLIDAPTGPYSPEDEALMARAISVIEAHGDPLKILSNP